ncbi:MAG: LacI family DNA-binding transcriptional regulator [Kiritimatiellales bacterium]
MPSKHRKTKSIVDVAKKAGVSVTTVSRVINDSPLAKPTTKAHVLKIAEQLGYFPAVRRPGPKSGASASKKKIAFVMFVDRYHTISDVHSFSPALQRGVQDGGRDVGFSIEFQLVGAETDISDTLANGKFSGFILHGMQPHPTVEIFLRTQPCCWVMNNPWTPTWGDHVMPDHREAGMMAAKYLISHGCRKLTIIKLGRADRVSALREEGFCYVAGKQGISTQALVAVQPLPEARTVYPEVVYIDEIITQFKKTVRSADGIFFDCDQSMVTLYPEMVCEEIIVPGKTILIGCNNQQACLAGIKPFPATMDVHFEQIGRMGVAQLAWRIKNHDCRRIRSLISPTLISLS